MPFATAQATGSEAVVAGEIEIARIELRRFAAPVLEHRAAQIVDHHLPWHAERMEAIDMRREECSIVCDSVNSTYIFRLYASTMTKKDRRRRVSPTAIVPNSPHYAESRTMPSRSAEIARWRPEQGPGPARRAVYPA
ncbi:MAG: hypothetical protein IPK44_12700 [Candidatus Accumulibacter sp.]|uniref:hypothetical protein n=1 Tax=Accumulibacter sp. TaxID=2053492 RepID=UPI002582681F|nr:hypothetical protein [Accumulibacter sp.]MBK8115320.1 hypothetical protein [Accumulibacter sp.]